MYFQHYPFDLTVGENSIVIPDNVEIMGFNVTGSSGDAGWFDLKDQSSDRVIILNGIAIDSLGGRPFMFMQHGLPGYKAFIGTRLIVNLSSDNANATFKLDLFGTVLDKIESRQTKFPFIVGFPFSETVTASQEQENELTLSKDFEVVGVMAVQVTDSGATKTIAQTARIEIEDDIDKLFENAPIGLLTHDSDGNVGPFSLRAMGLAPFLFEAGSPIRVRFDDRENYAGYTGVIAFVSLVGII